MKLLLTLTILITNLLSHSLIIENKENKDLKNCYFKFNKFHRDINLKQKIYKNNKEYKIIGLAYEECKDKKNKFKNIYTFYAMIEIENANSLQIKNGKYSEIHTQIIERYKIDMDVYLGIENKIKSIRKKALNKIIK